MKLDKRSFAYVNSAFQSYKGLDISNQNRGMVRFVLDYVMKIIDEGRCRKENGKRKEGKI